MIDFIDCLLSKGMTFLSLCCLIFWTFICILRVYCFHRSQTFLMQALIYLSKNKNLKILNFQQHGQLKAFKRKPQSYILFPKTKSNKGTKNYFSSFAAKNKEEKGCIAISSLVKILQFNILITFFHIFLASKPNLFWYIKSFSNSKDP